MSIFYCPHCRRHIDKKLLASHLGKEGGAKAGAKNLLKGRAYFSKIGKLGSERRWKNHVKKNNK